MYIYSQSEEGKAWERELLRGASEQYQRGLKVCEKLVGELSDRELLEMRARLYLNLGLVYEAKEDLLSAKTFMEKALGIAK